MSKLPCKITPPSSRRVNAEMSLTPWGVQTQKKTLPKARRRLGCEAGAGYLQRWLIQQCMQHVIAMRCHICTRIRKISRSGRSWLESKGSVHRASSLEKGVRTCAKEIGTPAREALLLVRGRRTQSQMYGDGELKLPKNLKAQRSPATT